MVLQDQSGGKRLNVFLDISLQRSCAIGRIIGRVRHEGLGFGGQTDADLPVGQPFVEVFDDQVDDAGDVGFAQRAGRWIRCRRHPE